MSIDHEVVSSMYDVQARLGLVDLHGRVAGLARTNVGFQVILDIEDGGFPAYLLLDSSVYMVATLSNKQPPSRYTPTKTDPDAERKLELEILANTFTNKLLKLIDKYGLGQSENKGDEWAVEVWFDSSIPTWIMHTPSGWEREVHSMSEAKKALMEVLALAQESLVDQISEVEPSV